MIRISFVGECFMFHNPSNWKQPFFLLWPIESTFLCLASEGLLVLHRKRQLSQRKPPWRRSLRGCNGPAAELWEFSQGLLKLEQRALLQFELKKNIYINRMSGLWIIFGEVIWEVISFKWKNSECLHMHLFHDVELTLRSVTSSTAVSRRGTNSKVEKIKKNESIRSFQIHSKIPLERFIFTHVLKGSKRCYGSLLVVVSSVFSCLFLS